MVVQVFEVPVDIELAGIERHWEVHVPNERDAWTTVNVIQHCARNTYTVEFSREVLDLNAAGLTATIQQTFLAIRDYMEAHDGRD